MRSLIGLAVLILTIAAVAQQVPQKIQRSVTVISSHEAKGSIDPEQLQKCLWLLLEQQGLSDREPPKILVLHLSKSEAAVAGVYDHVVRVESGDQGEDSYYQVWLVDNFSAADYTVAFQAILRKTFALPVAEKEERTMLVRVLRAQAATFNVTRR